MNKFLILKTAFALMVIGLAGAVYALRTKQISAEFILLAVLVSSIVFIIVAVLEVKNSASISKSEKTMWILGFVLTPLLAGAAYLFSGRKRVIFPN